MRTSQLSVAVALWLLLAACGQSPSSPSSAAGAPPPSGLTMSVLRVDGPARIAPGETARYAAIATYSDGSARDISATATWSPSNLSASLYFTTPGTAVGARAGEAVVFATIGATRGSLPVLVLPKGTFKLAGRVVETSERPLEGVSINVVAGTGAGLHTAANSLGDYSLYGVAGPTRLRVSGDGFTEQVRDVIVTADTTVESFVLAPKEPPNPGFAGNWTMTLTPSPTCPTAPPDIAKGRTYQVQVRQQGSGLTLTISGPTVTVYNEHWDTGSVFGSRVKLFFIGDTNYGDWSSGYIIDRLSALEELQFNGIVEGELKDLTVMAKMSGDIVYYDRRLGTFSPNWYCRATDHAVVLRK
jgi:hypothetical protein